MIAALRAQYLPARYVSGYLLTDAPPGQPGCSAPTPRIAWVAAYAPGSAGWNRSDPANDQLADARYITLAWGADWRRCPAEGVIAGGGQQAMTVEVSVLPA